MSLDDKSDEFLNKQQEAPTVIDNETIRKLALLKPVAYDRARVAKAKELGIRPAVLDAEVKAAKSTEKLASYHSQPLSRIHTRLIQPSYLTR